MTTGQLDSGRRLQKPCSIKDWEQLAISRLTNMHPNKHMDGAHHPHLIYFNLLKIYVLTHNLDPTTRFFTKITSNA
jgi:hypothetical protein